MANSVRSFSNRDIQVAAGALAIQVSSGVQIQVAVGRMPRLQPKHAGVWRSVQRMVGDGVPLSEALQGYWTDSALAALGAGERSGNVSEVLKNLELSLESLGTVRTIAWQLAYPLGIVLAGLGVFVFFMIGVLPAVFNSGMKISDVNTTLVFSRWMHGVSQAHGPAIAMGVGATVLAGVAWLAVPANRGRAMEWVDRIPTIGDALRSLWFGAWAYQMATLDKAGSIPVHEGLRLSASVLPMVYQRGLKLMADEVSLRGLESSSLPDETDPLDPRSRWPFYVSLSFSMAHDTGSLGDKLLKFAPALVAEGTQSIKTTTSVMSTAAMMLSGVLMGVPMSGYFSVIAEAMKAAFK